MGGVGGCAANAPPGGVFAERGGWGGCEGRTYTRTSMRTRTDENGHLDLYVLIYLDPFVLIHLDLFVLIHLDLFVLIYLDLFVRNRQLTTSGPFCPELPGLPPPASRLLLLPGLAMSGMARLRGLARIAPN